MEDEIARRMHKALCERVRRARFEKESTLEDFDFALSPKLPVGLIRVLPPCATWRTGSRCSSSAQLGWARRMWLRSTAPGLPAGILGFLPQDQPGARRSGRGPGRWRLRRLSRIQLLILDSFGLRGFTQSQGDDLFELISERHRKDSLVLTSNRAPKDWYELFPNATVADAVLDRLLHTPSASA